MNKVGSAFDVSIEVAAWDAAGADVELSCAAVFSREAAGAKLAGGLAHLDAALDGRLVQLRAEGVYTAAAGECLLVAKPSPDIHARAVLLVGMGDPTGWSTLRLREAVRAAGEFALAMGVRSAAFAPGMLDSGLGADGTIGASAHMVEGLAAALQARSRLADFGLATPPVLERWVFDVGAARLAGAIDQFSEVLLGRSE